MSAGSKATLRNRLRAHLGLAGGGGNHRASVFRLHVGRALIERASLHDAFPDWGKGQSASKAITDKEIELEREVTNYIRKLRVLYIPISDEAGKNSHRAIIEKLSIALLTEHFAILDPASNLWLGHWSDRSSIRSSGLWNVRGVGEQADLDQLGATERLVQATIP